MHLSSYKKAIIGLMIANIIWGASAPIFKWSFENITPMSLGFFRFVIATLILLPFVLRRLRVRPHDLLKLFFLGFIGFGLNIGLTLWGLNLAPSINAPVIGSSVPVFLLLGSMLFLKERTKSRTIVGTFISLLGVLIIVIQPILRDGFDTALLGNILFVLSNFALIAYTLLLKKYDLPYSPLTITFWLFFFAALNFLAFIPLEGTSLPNVIFSLDIKGFLGILYGAVFTSTVAYVAYNFAVTKIKANEIGVFLYVDPIVAALIAAPLLGEKITLTYLIGTFLVFAGIFIAERRLHYHPLHKIRG